MFFSWYYFNFYFFSPSSVLPLRLRYSFSASEREEVISPLEGGLRGMIYLFQPIISLLHLHDPLHGAVFIDEQHEGVFAARDGFAVEVGDFNQLFGIGPQFIDAGEVQGEV